MNSMKRIKASAQRATATAIVFLAISANCQGTFNNLNFEASLIPQTHPPGYVSSLDGFPFWSVFIGTNQLSQVFFDEIALGSTFVDLLGTNGSFAATSLEGGFSAGLQG